MQKIFKRGFDMKKIRKGMVLILTFCVLFSMVSGPAYADSMQDTGYVYRYEGDAVRTSSHHFTFQWMRGDEEWERVRNRCHDTNIFTLTRTDKVDDSVAAYCADFISDIVNGTDYRCINLEDSTYYNDAAARHIRGIMEKGYWHTWTASDLKSAEDAANSWLAGYEAGSFQTDAFLPGDAEEEVSPILNLTADEALMATQLAIWAFANTEGDGFWVRYYEAFAGSGDGYDYAELPSNVKTFRKYLIHQQSSAMNPDDIVFTDQYFVTDTAAAASKNGDGYDVTVRIKPATDIEGKDDLVLSADIAGHKTQISLTGSDAVEPDENGYYPITVKGVTEEEIGKGVKLSVSGSQYVSGVYFYEAEAVDGESARYASQNLVGRIDGSVPVSAKAELPLEPEIVEPEEDDPEKEDPEPELPTIGPGIEPPEKGDPPVQNAEYKTGDDFDPSLYTMIMAAGVLAMIAAMVIGRKRRVW